MNSSTTLAVFAKPPLPGQCKARLAAVIGAGPAAELAAAMLRELVTQTADCPALQPELWYPPECDPAGFAGVVPRTWPRYAQVGGDLGQRLGHCAHSVLARGPRHRVLITGADSADHLAAYWRQATEALDQVPVVLQPAHDGGYLLIGLRQWTPEAFHEIPWSTAAVMSRTREQLLTACLPWAELPMVHDLDLVSDLPSVAAACQRHPRPHLAAWLNRYGVAPAPRVLLTGMSGTGKSSVIHELRQRGYRAIDLDEPGWTEMDAHGHQLWRENRVQALLAEPQAGPLFISGCAENQVQFYPQFTAIILLSAPPEFIRQRLATRTNNPYGKTPAELAKIIGEIATIEPLLRRRATHEIITTLSLAEVVAQILATLPATRPTPPHS